MKLLIAGGGTGGHLFSGVAVAEALPDDGKNKVLFVGTRRGVEARVLPRLNLPVRYITVGGLKRMGPLKTLINLFKLPISFLQSLWIVLTFWPDVALGVGGYASGPTMLAAWLLGRPTAIIEQNSVPGITNRILGKIVRAVVTHFERAAAHFPTAKISRLGNPVRRRIAERAHNEKHTTDPDGRLRILITGGSQGAHGINAAIADALPLLAKRKDSLRIRHQTGVPDAIEMRKAYTEAGFDAEVEPFIDDMPAAFAETDLVVCRAGAGTCAEVSAMGLPALFVPLPTASDDHQTANAAEVVGAGGAWMVAQSDFDEHYAKSFFFRLLDHPEELANRRKAAASISRANAALNVLQLLKSLAAGKKADKKKSDNKEGRA